MELDEINEIEGIESQYVPLPEFLSIQSSGIHGQGLFTSQAISKESCLGISHVKTSMLIKAIASKRVFRTPLGGHINHSDTPNCEKVRGDDSNVWLLYTLRDIEPLEELTLNYTFYKV